MKRMTWMGLPLAFVLGCHHNLVPDSHGVPECKSCSHSSGHFGHGAPVTDQMMRRFSNTRTQVAFLSPMGMSIGWESGSGAGRTFMPAMLTVPGRVNFDQAAIEYQTLIEKHPKFERMDQVSFEMGNNAYIGGKYDVAIASYETVVGPIRTRRFGFTDAGRPDPLA